MKYCHSCQSIIDFSNFKFCPYCGAKDVKNFDVKEFIPQEGCVIVFKFQKKKEFQVIYKKIKDSVNILEIGTGESKLCFASASTKEISQLFDTLARLLHNNDYHFYENGKKLRSANDIFTTRVCYAKRIVSETPEYYCFGITAPNEDITPNLVGCLQVGLDISPYASLYRSGEWSDIFGNYIFDKEKITTKAHKMVRKYRFCPFLNESTVQKFIDLWPKEINVHLDDSWGFWPPKKGYFAEGLKELGLKSNTNMQKSYTPEFPVVTNATYLTKIAKQLYHEETSINIQKAVSTSINTIYVNIFKENS
mgnify:CR=1 FL=1